MRIPVREIVASGMELIYLLSKRDDMKNSVLMLLLLFTGLAGAQGVDDYQAKEFEKEEEILPYQILYPADFSEDEEYPLILFLHGAGERGSDNQRQLIHGGDLFKEKVLSGDYPAIVVFPQCPTDEYWALIEQGSRETGFSFPAEGEPTPPMSLVMELLDDMLAKPYVKKDQVYVGGLSMGGMGTLELLSRRPTTFAAAIAICGGGNPDNVAGYAPNTSVWFFHGGKDDIVPVEHSLRMVRALQDEGADVTLTVYEEANHNSWDPAFAESDLLDWLFSKRLGDSL